MERGIRLEPEAADSYEILYFTPLKDGGFWADGMIGASPDRIYETENGIGVLEIKCPVAKTMEKYIKDPNTLVKQYEKQLVHHQYCTGAKEVTIFAYHPDYEPVRVTRKFDLEDHNHRIWQFIMKVKELI